MATTESIRVTELTEAKTIQKESLFLLTNDKTSNKLSYNMLSVQLNNDVTQGASIPDINTRLTALNQTVQIHTYEIKDLSDSVKYNSEKINGLCTAVDNLSSNLYFNEDGLSARLHNNELSVEAIDSIIGTTKITGTITDNITSLNAFKTTVPTETTFGPIKVGYETSGTLYGIRVTKDGQAYVDVPGGGGGGGGSTDARVNVLADISSFYAYIKPDDPKTYSKVLDNSIDIRSIENVISGDDDNVGISGHIELLQISVDALTLSSENANIFMNNIAKVDEEGAITAGVAYDMQLSTHGISTVVDDLLLSAAEISSYVNELAISTDSISSYTNSLALSVNDISTEVKNIKQNQINNIFDYKEFTTTESTIDAGVMLTVSLDDISYSTYTPIAIGSLTMAGSNLNNTAITNRWIDIKLNGKKAFFVVANSGSKEATLILTANIIYIKTTK